MPTVYRTVGIRLPYSAVSPPWRSQNFPDGCDGLKGAVTCRSMCNRGWRPSTASYQQLCHRHCVCTRPCGSQHTTSLSCLLLLLVFVLQKTWQKCTVNSHLNLHDVFLKLLDPVLLVFCVTCVVAYQIRHLLLESHAAGRHRRLGPPAWEWHKRRWHILKKCDVIVRLDYTETGSSIHLSKCYVDFRNS